MEALKLKESLYSTVSDMRSPFVQPSVQRGGTPASSMPWAPLAAPREGNSTQIFSNGMVPPEIVEGDLRFAECPTNMHASKPVRPTKRYAQ